MQSRNKLTNLKKNNEYTQLIGKDAISNENMRVTQYKVAKITREFLTQCLITRMILNLSNDLQTWKGAEERIMTNRQRGHHRL